jgi:cytochrome c2
MMIRMMRETRSSERSQFLVSPRALPIARFRLSIVVLAVLAFANFCDAQESKPGLIATYSDATQKISRVVSLPNLTLQFADSVHPQIDASFTAEWNGLLKIGRAGKYRIIADGADVLVNGQAINELTNLTTGEHPLRVAFKREVGIARLQLRWESEYFQNEPVPSAVLRHIQTPAIQAKLNLVQQDSVEQGRFLFAESGCANCHAASDWKLQSRRGPNLSAVGSRVTAGWLFNWLKNPHSYRKAAVMPVCLDTDQDRRDVTAFVMSLKAGAVENVGPANPEQVESGRLLFAQVGCAKCHDKDNNLDAVGSKYVSAAKLADFIANPHATDPLGRMPQLFQPVERHQASAVAQFLFQKHRLDKPYADAPEGNAARGAKLFATNGCASCHTTNSPAIKKNEVLVGPAFGRSAGLPLRHYWNFGSADKPVVQDHVTGRKEKVSGRAAFGKSTEDRGSAFDFNGQTSIELPHFHRPDTMTISVWVNTTKGGSIITWGRPGGGLRGSRELRMNIGQDGKNSVCYGEYNSDGGWKPVIVKPKNTNLTDGKWHHIAVVRKGESIKHYVDGKFQGSGISQKGGGDYTDRLLIGALGLQAKPSNYFTGLMDDLSVWEMAVSAQQVAALAAGQPVLKMAVPQKQEVTAFNVEAGCLSADVKRPLPDYQLNNTNRTALRDFLRTVQPTNGNSYRNAPLVLRDLRIRQFGCIKCHEMNDQNIQKGVAVDEKGRMVRLERPPRLTGAGARLTTSWLQDVLLEKKRNRPWLNLRMPHFGAGVSDVPQLIAHASGVKPESAAPKPDRSLATAGLEMIGLRRGKVACITCHDYRGINRRKDGVVPAPDLADAGRTVRHDWFDRWMHDPQRLEPGTSMPQLFLDVGSKERDLRISQLWSALYFQKDLPLPKGVLDQQTEGTRIVVKDKPVMFRMATVTPAGQIDRAINVGIPGGLNFTFDAVTCQLKYAWKGSFIDAGPAWNGRGGNPVKAGGEKLVTLKNGHKIRVGNATDTANPQFLGYRLEKHMPVFRYRSNGAIVEHRINVLDSQVTQKFVVRGATATVFYAGNNEAKFQSKTGKRVGDTIGYFKADVVEFDIVMPLGDQTKKK